MSSKWAICGAIGLVMLCLTVDAASAQERGQRGRMRGRSGLVGLAAAEPVQAELSVTGEQKEKLGALAEKYGSEMSEQLQGVFAGGFQNLTADERRQRTEKMAEVNRSLNAKYLPSLKEILKAEQLTRLQQIHWQSIGSAALADEAVIKELTITKEQQEKIAAVDREFQQKQGEMMQEARGGGGDFQQLMTKIRELTAQRDKQAEELLSKEQQEKFAQLKGKPFDVSQLRPAGGGRRRNQNN